MPTDPAIAAYRLAAAHAFLRNDTAVYTALSSIPGVGDNPSLPSLDDDLYGNLIDFASSNCTLLHVLAGLSNTPSSLPTSLLSTHVNALNSNGETALVVAVKADHTVTAKALCEAGADPNMCPTHRDGQADDTSALMLAMFVRHGCGRRAATSPATAGGRCCI